MSDDRDRAPGDLSVRLTSVLRRPDTWVAPPAGLEGDVLAALQQARDAAATDATTTAVGDAAATNFPLRVPPAVAVASDVIDLADRRERRLHRSRPEGPRRWQSLAAVAAVAAMVGAGTVALVMRPPGHDAEVILQATPLAPQASGRAAIRDTPSGFAVDLDIDGLAAAPEGTYYQAWLKNDDGDLVSIGTFHGREGSQDILLWSGIDPADYPTLTVTLQSEGEGATSSGDVVLQGAVR